MKKTAAKMLTLLLCIGMLMSMSGAVFYAHAAFIEGKPYDQYTYKEYMDLTSAEKVTFYKGFSSLTAFNRWYNAAKKAADDEKFVIGDNSINLDQLLKTEATIADKKYAKLSDALNEAASGDTIVLTADVQISSVIVPEGVTLDLCGKVLTVESFGFVPEAMGKIVDTAQDSTGLLKVEAEAAAFLSAEAFAQNTLPVYDAANGGYRFYSYTAGQGVAQADAEVPGAVKFWYQVRFDSTAAYELLYAGNSGIKLGVDVDYTGAETPVSFLFKKDGSDDTWSKAYGAFVLGYDDGTPSQAPWLWVRVQNADTVTGLTITPYITAGGTDIYLNPISYNP